MAQILCVLRLAYIAVAANAASLWQPLGVFRFHSIISFYVSADAVIKICFAQRRFDFVFTAVLSHVLLTTHISSETKWNTLSLACQNGA